MKVSFVGADRVTKAKLKKQLSGKGFAIYFTEDCKKAEDWLINERS